MEIGRTITTAAAATTATTSTTTSIITNTTTLEDTGTSTYLSRYCEINFQKRVHIKFLHHHPVKIIGK